MAQERERQQYEDLPFTYQAEGWTGRYVIFLQVLFTTARVRRWLGSIRVAVNMDIV